MVRNDFLLYGATGYTGQLIARLAAEYGVKPLLAGRNKDALMPLARKLNLEYEIIQLDDAQHLQQVLSQFPVVINTAGPFQYTAKPMIEACLATGTHYLDITGEINVFELARQYDNKAKEAGIIILPGAGFDVVPTDCMARYLKEQLPDASELKLAFTTINGGISHGTAMTMVEGLGQAGAARKNGKIVRVPVGQKGMWVDFGSTRKFVMSIPWGDISTAYHTTGIPDIETYTGISPRIFKLMKFQHAFNWLLNTQFIRNLARKKINNRAAGPSDEERMKAKSLVWGQVQNASGVKVQARLTGPEGYTLTSHSSLIIIKKILANQYEPGFHTPAGLFGADLVLEIPGVEWIPG